MFALCVFYVRFMCILCSLYVYFMFALCVFYVRFMCILCSLYVYFMFGLCSAVLRVYSNVFTNAISYIMKWNFFVIVAIDFVRVYTRHRFNIVTEPFIST